MQPPNVKNVLKDPNKGVTYNVIAYRTLSKQELLLAVRHYHVQKKAKKLKKGDEITIVTIIGHNE